MSDDESSDGVFTGYGIGSAVLGVIAVAAIALAALIWTQHRSDTDELRYRTRVMQAAAQWTTTLINMNKDTVEADMHKLHEGTVGQLNADFDSTVVNYTPLAIVVPLIFGVWYLVSAKDRYQGPVRTLEEDEVTAGI